MSKRQSTKMAESLTDLPPNILLEILVRLPLKTLFASKCVCKTFLNLTSPNSHFIELHSSIAAETLAFQFDNALNPSRLLRLLEPELRKVELKPIFQLPRFGRSSASYYRSSFRDVNLYVLVNSCNGLLYFVRRNAPDNASVVCNPVTNEYVMIPDVDLQSRSKSMWLGFSPGTNQYKVLRMFGSMDGDPVAVGCQVLVVGSGSWRNVRDTPLGFDHSWDSCFASLNGVICWLDHSGEAIVFFDFEREVFGDVALPPEFGEDQQRIRDCSTIGVLGGCLAMSYNDCYARHVDVWIMRKRGGQESWSKEFVVDTVMPTGRLLYGQLKPLQILRNGELLMLWIGNDLVYYDPRNKRLRIVGLNRVRFKPRVVAFTPSFKSLKDTLLLDKVIVQRVRPRGNDVDG